VKFAHTVHASGNDLLQLINEILDLSKVEAGKMPIDPRTFTLAEVTAYLEQTFQHIAEQKGLSFEIRTDRRVPTSMFSDVTRLQQILKNLLSNAFKFTSRGKVTLVVQPAVRGEAISFAVHDTGIGIPLDKHRLIFEAFQQADGTTSRKYGGTGLGLTISREIARLLGGSIDVVSAPEKGSTFTLNVPITYAGAEALSREDRLGDTAPDADVPPLPEDADFSGKKVLIVDDDGRNVFAIESILKARGMTVQHAENGKLAVELLQAERDFDAILMDTMMPEMDGISATRAIRDIIQFESLPIISLTAKAMKGDREKALAAGASEYVTKPVDPEKLLAILHVWMNTQPVSTAPLAHSAE
jgi:CheY-like chemotaxis protein/two-component sensor histidine kinase